MTTPPPSPPHLPQPAPPTLNLPPDVVDKLAPHHSVGDWWYNQGATVVGTLVALAAAIIAWLAIRRQVDANRGQIEANKDIADAQIEADDKIRRRKERLDVVTEAYEVVTEAFMWVGRNEPRPFGPGVMMVGDRDRSSLSVAVYTVRAKLDLYGMTDEANALGEFWRQCELRADRQPNAPKNLAAEHGKALKVLKAAVDS
jgi:hypothetical protein